MAQRRGNAAQVGPLAQLPVGEANAKQAGDNREGCQQRE